MLPPKIGVNGEVVPSGCQDITCCNLISLVLCSNPLKLLWAIIKMVFYTPLWALMVVFGSFKCCFDCFSLLFDPLTYHTPKEPTGLTINPLASSATEGTTETTTNDSPSKDGKVSGDASA